MNRGTVSVTNGPAEEFVWLVQRLRNGDAEAACEIVENYGPQLRRIARIRLCRAGLSRYLDSVDICQSVMAAFFMRITAGQFDLDSPDDLRALLTTMVRNRVLERNDYFRAARRNIARTAGEPVDAARTADHQESPSTIVSNAELYQQLRSMLTEEERWLLDERAAGTPWMELAAERGVSAETLRKRLERARRRVAEILSVRETNCAD